MKKKRVAAVITSVILVGGIGIASEAKYVEFTYNDTFPGVAILDCNSHGCAAATNCNGQYVSVYLSGDYINANGYYSSTAGSLNDDSVVIMTFYNDSSKTYYWAGSDHYVMNDYIVSLSKGANQE